VVKINLSQTSSTSFREIETFTCRVKVLILGLRIKFNIVSCDGSHQVLMRNNTQCLNTCVHVGHQILNGIFENPVDFLTSLLRDASVEQVPPKVALDILDTVHVDNFLSDGLSFMVIHSLHASYGLLEHPSVTESSCNALNFI
jgi:hypothetical protein